MNLQHGRGPTSPHAGRAYSRNASNAPRRRRNFSKVRIYGSYGEYFRELHDATREHAKGEENPHHACTAKIANGHAHALRHCVAVYRNSPRYTAESRQIRKT
ncbi:hypothetical protein [Burkholderia stabilis]|uniref:hypothetical protein n=1 Tax=Burkholderia stabilis TaxID=95485 RepID=UPI001F4B39B9|nr:hypothetical protein [Burkholderia stabilis]